MSRKITRIPRKKKKHLDNLVFHIIEMGRRRVVGAGYPPDKIMRAGMEAWRSFSHQAKSSGLGKALDVHGYFSRSRVKALKRVRSV